MLNLAAPNVCAVHSKHVFFNAALQCIVTRKNPFVQLNHGVGLPVDVGNDQ